MPLPSTQIREYLVEEGKLNPGFWDGIKTEVVKFAEGVVFAVGFHRLRTWFMLIASAVAVFFCSENMLNFTFSTSMTVVAVGTVFPIVFSIQAAYQSRESALTDLNEIKAGLIFVNFCVDEHETDRTAAARVDGCMTKLVVDIMKVLRGPCFSDGRKREAVHVVYDGFRELVSLIPKAKMPPQLMGGSLTTLRGVMAHFERVKSTKDTETPKGLRKFCYFLCITTPIFLAPYFASFCFGSSGELIFGNGWGCTASYFVAILYVIITGTLMNVQNALEDPFDSEGIDDIDWGVWSKYMDCMPLHGPDGPKQRKDVFQEGETENWVDETQPPAAYQAADAAKTQ
eukprot:CAMPEP_0181308380 /NCGR_PEP_ID=MMETSP1101-20121128/11431_1 /TAXON_ID=46948 /ORGANISM="Rhodomonas abbreviata, Strain Caron Lab Isolate" /LENGTH=341 /DNA_ID=CAMNT_0023414757 /DNA_START=18 /DNA_END=1043 /DNA_ORIENTATION=-